MNSPLLGTLPAQHDVDTRMGALLRAAGKLAPDDVDRVLRMQEETGIRFGEAAVRLDLVSADDVRQALARQFSYPYLQHGEGGLSPRLFAAYDPSGQEVEALRALRSQLLLRWFGRGRRALAIAGVTPADDATLCAANLAIVFAQLGERTLLVDANLRAPRQQAAFGIEMRQGLSDLLAGRAGLDVIAPVPAFAALSVLPAGTLPPNPQELLAREGFRHLHAALESRYDVILYDVPPFEAGADAVPVAARAGAALLVARRHVTRVAHLARAAGQLVDASCEVLGAVTVES